ncbi:DUF3563 family protein [Undibacterium arcticum]|uniref:DUF3563 family protein n=1 Tax=Undibacterium arcticum TaxID=1762892 RepID=A0ABV7F4W5_9BURK
MSTLPATNHLASLAPPARTPVSPFGRVSYKSAVKSVSAYLSGILNALAQRHEDRQRARQEAFLAEATSIYDLESRMRQLDRHDCQQPLRMMTGLR